MNKTELRFFTIADFREEEIWLRQQHSEGWRLIKLIPPCCYIFEECEPEDVIYRLDFKNNSQSEEYMQMCRDFGWEYCGKCVGWLYFRKPAYTAETADDTELFSDDASRCSMVERLIKTRMLPIVIIFFCCVIPNMIRVFDYGFSVFNVVSGIFFSSMFILYVYILVHCGRKLRQLKAQYEKE